VQRHLAVEGRSGVFERAVAATIAFRYVAKASNSTTREMTPECGKKTLSTALPDLRKNGPRASQFNGFRGCGRCPPRFLADRERGRRFGKWATTTPAEGGRAVASLRPRHEVRASDVTHIMLVYCPPIANAKRDYAARNWVPKLDSMSQKRPVRSAAGQQTVALETPVRNGTSRAGQGCGW